MSTLHKPGELRGFGSPLSPSDLPSLAKLERKSFSMPAGALWRAGRRVAGFTAGSNLPVTSGWAEWYCALYFNLGEGQVAVLFSQARNIDAGDNNPNGHSIAVYVKGNVGGNEKVDDLILELFDQMY